MRIHGVVDENLMFRLQQCAEYSFAYASKAVKCLSAVAAKGFLGALQPVNFVSVYFVGGIPAITILTFD